MTSYLMMCNILKMADRRVKRMKIWDLRSYLLCYVGYFSCLILMSSVEVIRYIFKIPDVNAFGVAPTIFIQFQRNFKESM